MLSERDMARDRPRKQQRFGERDNRNENTKKLSKYSDFSLLFPIDGVIRLQCGINERAGERSELK